MPRTSLAPRVGVAGLMGVVGLMGVCAALITTLGVSATGARARATPPPTTLPQRFSPGTLTTMRNLTGLDAEQLDNIMKLVNKPEQDSLNWIPAYAYCENIQDGRGITIGIFGATTGGPNDDYPDFPALATEFARLRGAASPSPIAGVRLMGVSSAVTFANRILKIPRAYQATFCNKIRAMGADPAYRQAMWTTFARVYWTPVVAALRARGFAPASALAIGALVDTALNQCADGPASLAWVLAQTGTGPFASEAAFLQKFLDKRDLVVDTHEFNQPPNGKHRVQQWRDLVVAGEWDLKACDAVVRRVTGWAMV